MADKEGIGQRLRKAIESQNLSIRRTSLLLSERGVRGASERYLRSVINSEDGSPRPGIPLLQAAAELLCVSPGWLAFGEGEAIPEPPIEVNHRLYGVSGLPRIVQDDVIRFAMELNRRTRRPGATLDDWFERVPLISSRIASLMALPTMSRLLAQPGNELEWAAYSRHFFDALRTLLPPEGSASGAVSDPALDRVHELVSELKESHSTSPETEVQNG